MGLLGMLPMLAATIAEQHALSRAQSQPFPLLSQEFWGFGGEKYPYIFGGCCPWKSQGRSHPKENYHS